MTSFKIKGASGFFILILLLCSCHKKPIQIETPPPTVNTNDIGTLKKTLDASAPFFDWVRMKAGVHFENPDNSYSAVATIKMRYDSLVWTSANMMIEVARAIVTKDSAMLVNRANKTYSKAPTSDLKNLFAIEGIDLKALQYLLLGYPPFSIKSTSTMTKDDGGYHVKTMGSSYKEEYDLDPVYLKLTRYSYEKNSTQKVTISYSEYTKVSERMVPQKIDFTIETPDKILLNLNLSDYAFLTFDEAPFSIPASYQPAK